MIFEKVSSSVTNVLAARTDIHSNPDVALIKDWTHFETLPRWPSVSKKIRMISLFTENDWPTTSCDWYLFHPWFDQLWRTADRGRLRYYGPKRNNSKQFRKEKERVISLRKRHEWRGLYWRNFLLIKTIFLYQTSPIHRYCPYSYHHLTIFTHFHKVQNKPSFHNPVSIYNSHKINRAN